MNNYSTLIAELKQARKQQNMTQKTLGKKLDMPQGYISKIERAEINLTLNNFIELARILGLELMLIPKLYILPVKNLCSSNLSSQNEDDPLYSLDENEDSDV